ncbi:MAG: hypothetical protein J6A37_05650 [Oscillospiraceae bacterium]|nr:hypothetical protein [Oscillospiraceae bacterium]
MYKIDKLPVENTQPWLRPQAERISWILSAKENNLKTVVFLYEAPDSSTFRYRVYNVCQTLEFGLSWRGSWFYADELNFVKKYIDKIDLIVISRFRWTFELESLISSAKRCGIRIAFDVDDMVYDIKHIPAVVNTLSVDMSNPGNMEFWFSYISRLQLSASLADVMITTNEFLAKKIRIDSNKDVYIIQNFYNKLQSDFSDKFYAQKQTLSSENDFVLGYFSGSPTHIIDFLSIAPEIIKLLNKYDDITIKILGYMDLPSDFDKWLKMGRIVKDPFVDFIELQRKIAEVDVNLVPLVNNDFSNCKSELKFYEASIVGTVTCAAPSYVFKEAIEHGVTGYLCDKGMWLPTLEMLYLSRKQGFTEITSNARKYCVGKYAYFNQTLYIEEIFENIFSERKKIGGIYEL